jgi:23S rRNA pseudouridine1911/1915/1917 synthase
MATTRNFNGETEVEVTKPQSPTMRHEIAIDASAAGERLDRALARALPSLSRSRIKGLIEAGSVFKDSVAVTQPSQKVRTGHAFVVLVPEVTEAAPEPQPMALSVVYEDDDVIVVDKPAGLVVHPGPGNPDRTLVNALLAHCGPSLTGIGGVRRPGIVHRLDKDTSGLLVAAKTEAAHRALSRQFAEHSVERRYMALVWGVPSATRGTIAGAIGRSPGNRKKMAVRRHGGKPATTHYHVRRVLAGGAASLVECRLETGRTHQVRVHLATLGHPLVGDSLYGRPRSFARGRLATMRNRAISTLRNLRRQALDAVRLGFRHPASGEELRFDRNISGDIKDLIDDLEGM